MSRLLYDLSRLISSRMLPGAAPATGQPEDRTITILSTGFRQPSTFDEGALSARESLLMPLPLFLVVFAFVRDRVRDRE